MGTDQGPLDYPTLEEHAQLARQYIAILQEVDRLQSVSDVTMGNLTKAKNETLRLLKSLGEFQISRTVDSLLGPLEVAGDRPGKESKEGFLRLPTTPLQILVARARDLHASWAEIGACLGMTQQGAHKAYSNLFDRSDM